MQQGFFYIKQRGKTSVLPRCVVFVVMLFNYPKYPYHWACRSSMANIWLIRDSEMIVKMWIFAQYWVTPHNTKIVQKAMCHKGLRNIARHHALRDINRL